jgi:hypothetical protein
MNFIAFLNPPQLAMSTALLELSSGDIVS